MKAEPSQHFSGGHFGGNAETTSQNQGIEPKTTEDDDSETQHATWAYIWMMVMTIMIIMTSTIVEPAEIEPEIDDTSDLPELTEFLETTTLLEQDKEEFDEDFYWNNIEGPVKQWEVLKSCIPEYREWKLIQDHGVVYGT